ncbi:MAG: hypothetical protein WCV71_04860 [Patescibacteria group bacterium]
MVEEKSISNQRIAAVSFFIMLSVIIFSEEIEPRDFREAISKKPSLILELIGVFIVLFLIQKLVIKIIYWLEKKFK